MIELKNIIFSVKDEKTGESARILDDVSFSAESGKYIVVTGPNGGGKTSVAKVMMGIYKPDSGRIFLNGEDITDKDVTERARLGISFGFQAPPRFKGLTVKDILNISAGRELRHAEICAILTSVGLCAADYLTRDVDTSLSGGEVKRIEIASVLAKDSPVMIFDEPEAGIDLWSFHRLTETFRKIHEDNPDRTLIIISHQERIINQADEVILISDGKLKGRGKPEDIISDIDSFAKKPCRFDKEQ